MYMYAYTYAHVYWNMYMYACTYAHVYWCMYCICMLVHMHMYIYTGTCTCILVHTHVENQGALGGYMYVYMYYVCCSIALTIGVPDVDLWDTAALGIDVVGPVQHCDCSLDEAHTTSEVKWRVAFSVTDQRVSIGFEKVLNDFMLASEDCQVQR